MNGRMTPGDRKALGGKSLWKGAALTIGALAAAGALLYLLWSQGAFLPRWVKWQDRVIHDRSGEYEITLNRESVHVEYGGTQIWTSPEGAKVQDVLSCDIDNDGEDELILLCWKIGRYGVHRPFWIEKDERKWSQHIFVYEYAGEEIRPKWMSSYIGVDVAAFCSNGKEGFWSRLLLTDPAGEVSCWKWDSWGFSREETDVSFVVFGDNLIHEPIYRYGLREDGGFDFLFQNIRDTIEESNVAVINQETPLTDDPARYGDYPRFGTPAQVGQAIVDAGFDVVTCATNHALDRGAEGVGFTKDFFTSRNVLCLGIQPAEEEEQRPYETITRNNVRFALLNYTYGTNGIPVPAEHPHMVHLLKDADKVREDVAAAKADSDFVIVFAHWGTEGSEQVDDFQREWAQVFLESGVDVVVGTHPHVLQSYEVLTGQDGREMLVYYSIGNYISAQREESCVKGGMACFTVSLTAEGYKVTEYGLQPLTIRRREDGSYMVEMTEE